MKNSVIIVEDDEITALNLKLSLKKQGYNVLYSCDNISDAQVKIDIVQADIIIIDISLQGSSDGIEFAKIVKTKNIPFIFLTSYSDDDIISQAKLVEPYGYIVKPFDPNSLHATIQMALFNYKMENKRKNDIDNLKIDKSNLEKLVYSKKISDKPLVPFGIDYKLDISNCEIFYKNKKVKLTKKENAFMRLLVSQLGLVVDFKQAIKYIWEEGGATENSVRTLVWRLRNKLDTDIIKNASGIGYYIEE